MSNLLWLGVIFSALALQTCNCAIQGHLAPMKSTSRRTKLSLTRYRCMSTRGGALDDEDSTSGDDQEEGDDEDEEESLQYDEGDTAVVESPFSVADTLVDMTKRTVILLAKATVVTAKAMARAVVAGISGEKVTDQDEEGAKVSVLKKIMRAFSRMWTAALTPSEGTLTEESAILDDSTSKAGGVEAKSQNEPLTPTDFGMYLSSAYHVSADREESAVIMGGTIGDALRDARSKARLLVVFIPSSRPGPKKKITSDQVAIRSLLSRDVARASSRSSRKSVDYGSFVLWGAKTASPEAMTAIKRLKAKQPSGKNQRRPFLLVAYPAQVIDSSGKPKLVPKLLAQHHCSPPPSAESMGAWLNALRKRHAKQYASMHHALKEMQLFKERTEGYKSSVQSDVQRRASEEKAERERGDRERAEKERREALEMRREQLRQSLPEEPGKEIPDVMTIALRFADGQSGQRRFLPDTPMQTIFNWVDATYNMEREQVILTTMNGQRAFEWKEGDSMTLGSSGVGRMTGLRVSEKKLEAGEPDTESNASIVNQ